MLNRLASVVVLLFVAVACDGRQSPPLSPLPTPLATLPPAAPTNLVAIVISPTRINLTWTNTTTSADVVVHIERSIDAGPFREIATLAATVNFYGDTTLSAGMTASYRVSASNPAGVSGYSNSVTATAGEPNPWDY